MNFIIEALYALNITDIIVHGEGELTFEEILTESLKDNPNYLGISGCSFITNDGHMTTLPRNRIVDLSQSPSPYLIPIIPPA